MIRKEQLGKMEKIHNGERRELEKEGIMNKREEVDWKGKEIERKDKGRDVIQLVR